MQGRDRLYVKFVAEQLGLDGSYIPRTYIEQIQLEKLMNDVMVCILLIIYFHCLFCEYIVSHFLVILLSLWLVSVLYPGTTRRSQDKAQY